MLKGETILLVETTDDGGILLHPAGVYPLEIYSEEQIKEFLEGDRLTPQEAEQLDQLMDAE